MMNEQIQKNLQKTLDRIVAACHTSGRTPQEIRLLLATKTVPVEHIKIALETGQTLIAENKIQEVKEKYYDLKNTIHESHFIGHLQTNKIKDVLKYDISCIQSVDRIDLAEKLNQRLQSEDKTMDILIQVNTSEEESKFGVPPNNTIELVEQVARLSNLKIKGLMTIGLFSADCEKVRPCFRILKDLQRRISALNIPAVQMKELSMGMSNDLETAIEEGATIVRVGTAIFGKRIYSDNYYWNENN